MAPAEHDMADQCFQNALFAMMLQHPTAIMDWTSKSVCKQRDVCLQVIKSNPQLFVDVLHSKFNATYANFVPKKTTEQEEVYEPVA